MSQDELNSIASAEKRRATVPEIAKPQDSFENRYSNIIHKQILENSINMNVLQRQMAAFLSFSKSPPKSLESEKPQTTEDQFKSDAETSNQNKTENTEPQKDQKDEKIFVKKPEEVSKNSTFQKAITVDIAEHKKAEQK